MMGLDVVHHHRHGEQIVGRDVEKPWIWPACRSMVSTRLAPARVIRLATSLAEIGVRGPAFGPAGHSRNRGSRR